MSTVTVAAVQAAYVLMDREATLAKVECLMADPAVRQPIWSCSPRPLCQVARSGSTRGRSGTGDEQWFAMLRTRLSSYPARPLIVVAAREANAYLVIGVDEREPSGSTIYNTLLYFDPEGNLIGKHRKLMPTGMERPVWGIGDGSTLVTYPTPFGRLGGLICWENYMPLDGSTVCEGVDVWVAPTPATRRQLARDHAAHRA